MSDVELQKKLQDEFEVYLTAQKEFQRAVGMKTQLDGQLKVNTTVKEELQLLNDDAELYKLIGPVLIKQELGEARVNVNKRIEYITKEIKKVDDHIIATEKKQEALQEKIAKMKNEYSQMKATA